MYSIVAIALTALLGLNPATAAPAQIARDVAPLEFTMSLPEYFCANSHQTLFWRGGPGNYTVTSVLHYSGHDASDDKTTGLVNNSSDKRYEIAIGRVGSEFPAGSTYAFTVEDPAGLTGSVSTNAVPIYNC